MVDDLICCSEIVKALKRRGLTVTSKDADMMVSVKKAVRRLCASDVVIARILEKERISTKCSKILHKLTDGKVTLALPSYYYYYY